MAVRQQSKCNKKPLCNNKTCIGESTYGIGSSGGEIVSLATSNVEIIKTQVEEGTKLMADLNKEIEALINQQKKLWQTQYDLLKKTID